MGASGEKRQKLEGTESDEENTPMKVETCGEFEETRYEIQGSDKSAAIVKLNLKEGQTVRAVPGTMLAMSDNIIVSGKLNKSIKSLLMTGDSRYQELTSDKRDGWVMLSPPFSGDIRAVRLNDEEICIGDQAFVCSVGYVKISAKGQSLKNSLVNGMFRKSCKGTGVVFVAAVGSFVPFQLGESVESQSIFVNNDNVVAWPAHINYECVRAGKSWFSTAVSGEGFVAKLSGSGTVLVQSRNALNFASWIYDSKAPPTSPVPIVNAVKG